MFVFTPLRRNAGRWAVALAACQSECAATAPRHTAPHLMQWTRFFDLLEDNSSVSPSTLSSSTGPLQRSFELAPSTLLRQIGQLWVDQALAAVVARRLADVYKSAANQAAHSGSGDSDEKASFEALLALWSAHTMLAALREASLSPDSSSSASRTQSATPSSVGVVIDALVTSLRLDVLPVVSYLAAHSPVCVNGAGPSRLDVVHRAMVLVLSSFVSVWVREREGEPTGVSRGTPLHARDDSASPLSPAEAAVARVLSQCLAILHSAAAKDSGALAHTEGGRNSRADVCVSRREVHRQSEELQATVKGLCGSLPDARGANDVLGHTLKVWIHETESVVSAGGGKSKDDRGISTAEARLMRQHVSSAFVGITGVQPEVEEAEGALRRVNEALNQVALSSAVPVEEGGK